MAASYHDRLKDSVKLNELVAQDARWGEAEQPPQFLPEFLQKVGITQQPATAGQGYIKLLYPDFIVEELTEKGQIATVEPGPLTEPAWDSPQPSDPEKRLRLEVELVKQGYNSFEALERLAEALNLPMNQLTYAGLKDGKAVTSQRISINSVSRDQLQGLAIPNLFLKNAHYRVGMRNIGELAGNRFTILVRTGEFNQAVFEQRLKEVKEQGFLNFFSLQRFGSRLQTHLIGRLTLHGQYEEALRLFLVGSSPHEGRALQAVRRQAREAWGNWPEMVRLFSAFPYFFQNELRALGILAVESGNLTGALQAVGDQIKFAVSAYGSYCFNRVLSLQLAIGRIDETLPLLEQSSALWYQRHLPEEGLEQIRWHHPLLKFLGETRRRQIPSRVQATIHSVTSIPEGLIFHFDLGKGSYATTFLAEFFQLYQGRPVPEWVNQTSVDSRLALGYPSVKTTEEAFPKAEPGVLEPVDE